MQHPGDETREAAITRAYTELARISRRASIHARETEGALSVVDHSLLDFIAEHPECIGVDIAKHLRLNRSTISRQVTGLLASGLVDTVASGGGNVKPLVVTPAGHAALARTVAMHRQSVERRVAEWSDADVVLLAGILERFGLSSETEPEQAR